MDISTTQGTVRLGNGHCCVCTGVCYHIGPVQLCAHHSAHLPVTQPTPGSHYCPICGVRH